MHGGERYEYSVIARRKKGQLRLVVLEDPPPPPTHGAPHNTHTRHATQYRHALTDGSHLQNLVERQDLVLIEQHNYDRLVKGKLQVLCTLTMIEEIEQDLDPWRSAEEKGGFKGR